MISQQMEEYLEAIGKLDERGEPVTTSAVARECKVAPPTVTEMFRRLSDQGLIEYEPRKEITLTQEGRRLATTMIRRHRLWERFLHDVLGLKWDKVHDQACQLEHATSPDLEQRIAHALGEPATCPHGQVIPDMAIDESRTTTIPLSLLTPGRPARVVRVSEEGALLRLLTALDLKPGSVVEVEATAAGDGELALRVDGQRGALPRDVASLIEVVPLRAAEGDNVLESGDAVPLGQLAIGETACVKGFVGGRGLMGRCLALGFTPGVQVRMVQNLGHGPVIVLVRDTRVALGHGEAQKILVIGRQGNHAKPN